MRYLKPDDIKPNDILDKGIINNDKQNIMEYLHLRKKKAFEVPYVEIMSIAKSEDKYYKPKTNRLLNFYQDYISDPLFSFVFTAILIVFIAAFLTMAILLFQGITNLIFIASK